MTAQQRVAPIDTSAEDTPQDTPDAHWTPAFHFVHLSSWINDPNGLIVHGGRIHLCYQLNPHGLQWGHISWGHATSEDYLRWTIDEVAIPESQDAASFSGSVVHDVHNTSGLGENGAGPLVALYTAASHANYIDQHQHLAYSNDGGASWRKHGEDPVLRSPTLDRRDPKVFHHRATDCWIMLLAHADTHQVGFYRSGDLIHWEAMSTFGPLGACEGEWECPDLVELVEASTGTRKHVLLVATAAGHPAGGSGVQYFVGTFDGERFTCDSSQAPIQWLDLGPDFYAAQTFNDVPPAEERTIITAWMANRDYADKTPTRSWRGCHTVPRELSLHRTDAGWTVSQQPVAELAEAAWTQQVSMRRPTRVHGRQALGTGSDEERCYHIELLVPRQRASLSLRVLEGSDGACGAIVTLDQQRNCLEVERPSAYASFCSTFARTGSAPLPEGAADIRLRILLDRSTLEVFVGEGGPCLSWLVFAPPDANGVSLVSESGCEITTLKVRRGFDATGEAPSP